MIAHKLNSKSGAQRISENQFCCPSWSNRKQNVLSSGPHPLTIYLPQILTINLFAILSGIQSDISSDMYSDTISGILSHISPAISSDSLSGILFDSDFLSGMFSDIESDIRPEKWFQEKERSGRTWGRP